MARRKKRPLPPPSLPSADELLAMAWQHLDQQHPHERSLWHQRCWVTGDRASAFMAFSLGTDLRMRVYEANSGRLLAESPPNRSRKPMRAPAPAPAPKPWRR